MRRNAIILLLAAFLTAPATAGVKGGLLEAIERIEREEGALSIELYQPLQELGLTLLENGEHELALDTFRRMQHLIHQTFGVHAPEQMKSVELIIEAYSHMGDFAEVETQQRFIYDVAKRAFAPGDPNLTHAKARLARWYRNTARFDEALKLYRSALEELNKADEQRHVALLRAEALTLYLAGECCASEKLSEVAGIVANSDKFDFQEKRRAIVDHADMLTLERADGASVAYKTAFAENDDPIDAAMLGLRNPRAVTTAILSSRISFSSQRSIIDLPKESSVLFSNAKPLPVSIGNPVPVCSATVEEVLRTSNVATINGYFIDVDVEIDDRGRAQHIETDGNAPVALNRYLRSVLRETRYRPTTSSEGTASSSSISFRQTFAVDNGVAMTNDLSGWNALLTKQACQVVQRHGISVMNASVAAD